MADIVPAEDRGGYIGISNIGPMVRDMSNYTLQTHG